MTLLTPEEAQKRLEDSTRTFNKVMKDFKTPYAIGIGRDLKPLLDIPSRHRSLLMSRRVGSKQYLIATTKASHWYDLNGNKSELLQKDKDRAQALLNQIAKDQTEWKKKTDKAVLAKTTADLSADKPVAVKPVKTIGKGGRSVWLCHR